MMRALAAFTPTLPRMTFRHSLTSTALALLLAAVGSAQTEDRTNYYEVGRDF